MSSRLFLLCKQKQLCCFVKCANDCRLFYFANSCNWAFCKVFKEDFSVTMSKQDWWCAMHCTCSLQKAVKQCWWRCWGFPTQLRSPALSPLRWLFQYDKSEFVTKCAILMPGPVIQKPHAFSPINDILRKKLHNRDNFKVSFYLCIACQSLKMDRKNVIKWKICFTVTSQ